MKTVNQTFTDEEMQKLQKTKGEKSWHDFILELVEKETQLLNLLQRFYNRLTYPIEKWWDMRVWKRFLNRKQLRVITRIYDEMWKP